MKPSLTLITALLLAPLAALAAADAVANGAAPPEILVPHELALVRELATATLETCGVAPGAIARGKTNTLGFRAITPGGYPAIWIQDFTMNFSSGLIAREDGLRHFQLILEKQNGPEPRDLGQQVVIPAHAIPDHINVDGAPVFFPGTYDPSANMNGDWGFRPPSNNPFDVIWLAHMLARSGDAKALLSGEVGGRTVYERLKLAFAVPEIDLATQLVRTTAARRAVGFIFYDAIEMTGDLLMASLIRYRAALHLAWLATKMDQPEDAKHYADVAQQIRSHIQPVFGDTDGTHGGWLKASNGISGQSDVWGSIYAIYIGAVEGEARAALLRTITAELAKPGEIEFEGALRHVPLSGDASPTTMWEKARPQKNRYENGAYWHIPVGWLLTILQPEHPELAQTIKRNWLGHLRAQQGRVWECIGWDGQANKNPSYGTSIALPLGVLSRGELRADRLLAPLAADPQPTTPSRDDAGWLRENGTLLFHDAFEREETGNGMKAIGNGWESATAERVPQIKQADLDGGILKLASATKEAGHAAHIHHDAGFADGGAVVRFKFPGLNKDEALTVGFVDRETKGIHAGHLCYGVLSQSNIALMDWKTGVMNLEIRKRRQEYLDRKEKLPADLEALLKTKQITVPWKADTDWHELVLVTEGDELRLSIDGKLLAHHHSEGFAHPMKRWFSFLMPNTVWIDDVKIWKVK